jgi:hypothetical protein
VPPGFPHPRSLSTAGLAAALVGLACAASEPPGLTGWWSARLEHAGSTAAFHLRIREGRDGTLHGSITIPPIDVFDAPIGPIRAEDDTTFQSGLGPLRWDPEGRVLLGRMPASLVPVHGIDLRLEATAPGLTEPQPAEVAEKRSPLWSYDAGAPVWAGLATIDDTVFAAGDDGTLHALDLADGSLRWQLSTNG